MEKHKLYTEPDCRLLETIAGELGIDLTIDPSIRGAQRLFEQGVQVPGTESGHTPMEITYMAQILKAVTEKQQLPTDLRVYMNDRGFERLEETVPMVVRRETGLAFKELSEVVERLHQSLCREREV
jgi:hypothetical protein